MTTELEQFAKMVGNPDLEPLDTAELIADSLRQKLGGANPEKVREIEEEIRNSGNTVENPKMKKIAANGRVQKETQIVSASTEKVLLALYDTRDGMIQAFETCNINSKTASILSGEINRLGSCIRYMGGDVEEFEPLNHISGLSMPNFYKNAQKVIETTMQCYSLGEVEDAKVLDNGQKIAISFTGSSGDTTYKAIGTITSNEWTGNEAIDYIYTPNSGKMSVKAFENGRWVNKESSGNYKITWELEETDLSEEIQVETKKTLTEGEEVTEGTEKKKEISTVIPNITDENSEEDIGSPLR